MKRICTGCGFEIPEGNDFCYECGAWADKALIVDDEGRNIVTKYCRECGKIIDPTSAFCPYCGSKTEEFNVPIRGSMTPVRYTNRDILAIFLAVIPGFFNIYGLGQIVQKKYAKAFTYICITLMLLYVAPSFTSQNSLMILLFIQLVLFGLSLFDVFKNIGGRNS